MVRGYPLGECRHANVKKIKEENKVKIDVYKNTLKNLGGGQNIRQGHEQILSVQEQNKRQVLLCHLPNDMP